MYPNRNTRRPNPVRLAVQALEARDVPAVLDVTFAGAEVTANGGIFRQADAVAADSGAFNTFLRLRDNAGNREEGYNTDARPFQFDQRGDLTVTHSLRLSDIPTVTVNGTVYREFLLHIDEGARVRRQTLSLDELRLFVGATGDLTGYNRTTRQLAGLDAVWDLDALTNNAIVFNDGVNGTLGKGDAVVLIPESAFAGADPSAFVYLYSRFGGQFAAHGGAEEWGVRPVPTQPTGFTLSGWVYLDHDFDGVREQNGNQDGVPETGIGDVVLVLTGVNDLGEQVNLTYTTSTADTNFAGFYEFTGLRDGTYTITRLELDPNRLFFDLLNTPGNDQWSVNESNTEPDVNGPDQIYNIVLAAGVVYGDNNFGLGGGTGPA